MPLANEHFEELKSFIRQHRSNEGNFETLSNKLEEEISTAKSDPQMSDYSANLEAIKEKQASEYRTAKENGGSAWPEFENFVSEWEKVISTATA